MHARLTEEGFPVTAPFFSVAGDNNTARPILLVGKATNGDWGSTEYNALRGRQKEALIRSRLRLNRQFIYGGATNSAFWCFFYKLAALGLGVNGMIWSNVAKIGRTKGNPSGQLLSRQAELAVRTLQAEVAEYQPILTVFVAGSDRTMSDIIVSALNAPAENWIKSEGICGCTVPDVWWMRGETPALWTQHPERKTVNQINFWLNKAQELAGLPRPLR